MAPLVLHINGQNIISWSLQPFLLVVGCLLNSRKFWCSCLLLSAFFSGNWTERRETSSKSCPSGLLCVEGCHPFHHWWMANEEANDESCKRTCDLTPSDMARWLSHKPPMPTWHANMITWHYMFSSHLISPSPFGVSPSEWIQLYTALKLQPYHAGPDMSHLFQDEGRWITMRWSTEGTLPKPALAAMI